MTTPWLVLLVIVALSGVASGLAPMATPFMPPNASDGTIASNTTSVPNVQWSRLLGDLLYFYPEMRSGVLGPNNRVPWRNDSCTSDGADVGLDLSGGFYDGGGYVKATYPLTFTLASLAWAGLDAGQGFELANQTANLDETLHEGLGWLMKANPRPDVLYVQVGDMQVDNAYWGGDRTIPQPRPSFAVTADAPGTDVVASASAAFALGAVLYDGSVSFGALSRTANSSLVNTTYAAELRARAEALWNFSQSTSKKQEFSKSLPRKSLLYVSSGYTDSEVWAAACLYAATGKSMYLDFVTEAYKSDDFRQNYNPLFWDSKAPAVPVLMVQLLHSQGIAATQWQSICEVYFDWIVEDTDFFDLNVICALTEGGLLVYGRDWEYGTLDLAANAVMLMMRYAPYASDPKKTQAYNAFCQKQVDYFLGKNPMNRPYIVGVHPNSPVNPHCALASGGNSTQLIDTVPVTERFNLVGAVVAGPDGGDDFIDKRSNWAQTQPSLHLNAPFVMIAATFVATVTTDPAYVSLQGGPVIVKLPSASYHFLINDGGIFLVLIGGPILLCALVVAAVFCYIDVIKPLLKKRRLAKERRRMQSQVFPSNV